MIDASILPLSGVTREELHERAKRLGETLRDNEIPLAIVGYNPDLFYFAGSIQQGFVLITQEGEVVYLAKKDYERARIESPLETILPFTRFKDIKGAIQQLMGRVPGTIALSFDVIPTALFFRFKDLLNRVDFVDGSSLIRSCRMTKSPFEIRNIQQGIEIYDKVIKQMPLLIREGMAEAEAEETLILAMRRYGNQVRVRMRGWNQEGVSAVIFAGISSAVPTFLDAPLGGVGMTPAVAIGGGNHKIQLNEPIIFDGGPGVNGYVSDQTRTAVLGRLPARLKNAYRLAKEMIQRFETEAKPGDACSDWFLKLEAMALKGGLVDHFMGYKERRAKYVGHGIGLELNEWPVLGKGLSWRLEPGMVIALEPKMVFPEVGAVGLENDYLMTEMGVKRLSVTDDEIVNL